MLVKSGQTGAAVHAVLCPPRIPSTAGAAGEGERSFGGFGICGTRYTLTAQDIGVVCAKGASRRRGRALQGGVFAAGTVSAHNIIRGFLVCAIWTCGTEVCECGVDGVPVPGNTLTI